MTYLCLVTEIFWPVCWPANLEDSAALPTGSIRCNKCSKALDTSIVSLETKQTQPSRSSMVSQTLVSSLDSGTLARMAGLHQSSLRG
jgi:hypothetical protein